MYEIPSTTGVIEMPKDVRDYQYSAIFSKVKYPRVFKRDLPNLDIPYQGRVPSCVACCFTFINQYKSYQEDKKELNLSFRKVHAETGSYDRGRHLRGVAKYLQTAGQPEDKYCADDISLSEDSFMSVQLSAKALGNSLKRKIGAYSFVNMEIDSLCQAILESPIAISLGGNNKSWSKHKDQIIRLEGEAKWYHCVALWDYNLDEGWFGIYNWWGDKYRKIDINYSLSGAISFRDLPDEENTMLNLIGDNSTKNQFALGKDGKLRLIYNAETLNDGHDAGNWNKEKVTWLDDISKCERGKDIVHLNSE